MEFGMGRYFQRSAPGVFERIGKKWEWLGWWPGFVAFLIEAIMPSFWPGLFVLPSAP
jgi:SNF family Na+-dependent transporter